MLEDLILKMEELGLKAEQVEEIISIIENKEQRSSVKSLAEELAEIDVEHLQIRLETEENWRKKAAIAARIISLRLGN